MFGTKLIDVNGNNRHVAASEDSLSDSANEKDGKIVDLNCNIKEQSSIVNDEHKLSKSFISYFRDVLLMKKGDIPAPIIAPSCIIPIAVPHTDCLAAVGP